MQLLGSRFKQIYCLFSKFSIFLLYNVKYQEFALTYSYHKQGLQNACIYKKSRTLSGIHNSVAGLHKVQELY